MKKKKEVEHNGLKFSKDYPFLLKIKPRERYIFHSDYIQVDSGYACILSMFHKDGATDSFSPFWGVNMIPSGLGQDITIFKFDQVKRMGDSWIDSHQSTAEGVSNSNVSEQSNNGTNSTNRIASVRANDLSIISEEIQNGSSYLHVNFRLMVKAPTLEKLDMAIRHIESLYTDRFATMSVAPYMGEQRRELAT